jgi:hypothetical protein
VPGLGKTSQPTGLRPVISAMRDSVPAIGWRSSSRPNWSSHTLFV